MQIGELLARAYAGRVEWFAPFFTEGPLVRIHYVITRAGAPTAWHGGASGR